LGGFYAFLWNKNRVGVVGPTQKSRDFCLINDNDMFAWHIFPSIFSSTSLAENNPTFGFMIDLRTNLWGLMVWLFSEKYSQAGYTFFVFIYNF
jgi:hypothetical protein